MNQTVARDAVVTTLNEAQMSLLATDHILKTIIETEDVGVGRPSVSNGLKTIVTVGITVALEANVPRTIGIAPEESAGAPVIAGTAHDIEAAEVTTTTGMTVTVAEVRVIEEMTDVTAAMATATDVTTTKVVAAATGIVAEGAGTADASCRKDPTNG